MGKRKFTKRKNNFIMSKSTSRLELYLKTRGVWSISPVTKIKKSDKKYNRKKEKEKFKKEVIYGDD